MNTIFNNITKNNITKNITKINFVKFISTTNHKLKLDSYKRLNNRRKVWIEEKTTNENIKESDMYIKLKLNHLYRSIQRKKSWILNTEYDKYLNKIEKILKNY